MQDELREGLDALIFIGFPFPAETCDSGKVEKKFGVIREYHPDASACSKDGVFADQITKVINEAQASDGANIKSTNRSLPVPTLES